MLAEEFELGEFFIIVDLRGTTVAVYQGFCRPWAVGGYRAERLFEGEQPNPRVMAADIMRFDTRIVMVRDVAGAGVEADAHIELASELVRAEGTVILSCDEHGTLLDRGMSLEFDALASIDLSRSTTVRVHGRQTRQFDNQDLPLRVRIDSEPSDEAPLIIGIEAESEHAHLPKPIWIRIPAHGRGTLVVDLRPRAQGVDRWHLSIVALNGEARTPRRIQDPTTRKRPRRSLDRVALVFDRTCVDGRHWTAAWETMLSGGSSSEVHDEYKASPANAEGPRDDSANGPTPWQDFNLEIRTALAEATETLLEDVDRVHVWWVADTAGRGMAQPQGVVLPDFAVAPAGEGKAGDTDRLLGQASWSPGLDIWDPMEEGLAQAVETLSHTRAHECGIVIVGNSPPTPLLTRDDPFLPVANSLGFMTSVRHTSTVWKDQLRLAREIGIPVVYLFLQHDHCDDKAAKNFETYKRVQARVRDALAATVYLISAAADRSGVHEGMRLAVERISRSPDQTSAIQVVGLEG